MMHQYIALTGTMQSICIKISDTIAKEWHAKKFVMSVCM